MASRSGKGGLIDKHVMLACILAAKVLAGYGVSTADPKRRRSPLYRDLDEAEQNRIHEIVKREFESCRMCEEFEPAARHQQWLDQQRARGWRWGPNLDEKDKKDPRMLPYEMLPHEERVEAFLLRAVCSHHCALYLEELNRQQEFEDSKAAAELEIEG